MDQHVQQRERKYINIGGRPANLPFSDGVLVGDTLFLSGRIGSDPRTIQAPTDVDEEIRLMLEGVRATLEQAEMSMDNLVYVQVYCTDLSLYDKSSTPPIGSTSGNSCRIDHFWERDHYCGAVASTSRQLRCGERVATSREPLQIPVPKEGRV